MVKVTQNFSLKMVGSIPQWFATHCKGTGVVPDDKTEVSKKITMAY